MFENFRGRASLVVDAAGSRESSCDCDASDIRSADVKFNLKLRARLGPVPLGSLVLELHLTKMKQVHYGKNNE